MNNEMYIIRKLNIDDLSSIIEIFKQNYICEQKSHEHFVSFDEIEEETITRLKDMILSLEGWAVIKEDVLVGYMIGYETGPLFGKDLGVFVPLFGHGATPDHKDNIYQLLFNHSAENWVSKDIFSLAIAMFAHDQNLKDFWFQNGFGMRCVDAIRGVDVITFNDDEVKIKIIGEEDLDHILSLHQAHNIYYRSAPIFMPNEDENPKTDLFDWLSFDNRKLFAVYVDDKVVGYMRIQETGESVITTSKKMMSITGAFVDPAYRGQSLASHILQHIVGWLKTHDYEYLGVDFESINPSANAFWSRYFKPYSISLTRRIDENIKIFT